MANYVSRFGRLCLLFSLYFVHTISASDVYIVYLGQSSRDNDPLLTSDYHVQLVTNVFQSKEEAKESLIYSYTHAFSGFAATLNGTQASVLENTEGVISVFKSKSMQPHTTRSWDFMGLTLDYPHGTDPLQLAHGSDIVVGLIDSGVWPESASFMEEPGIGRIPNSWKGECVSGQHFDPKKVCNKKLVGARYYLRGFEAQYGSINKTPEYRSPRDVVGHGTHTASTAVGSRYMNASLLGFAVGTARGGAPRARLAVYKACWYTGLITNWCTEEDTLAAFDDALKDGVNVISISFGWGLPIGAFFRSSADIGSFHAMQLGVSVVFAAGNSGPDPSLVDNVNPWSICVGASSMDRSFPTKILLDDGTSFVGEGLIGKPITGVLVRDVDHFFDGICNTRNWQGIPASGKILICFYTKGNLNNRDAEYAAYKANASALIFVQPLTRQVAALSVIPVVQIDTIQGSKLYLKSFDSMNINVQILQSDTAFKRSPAPRVSQFSSRGPSSISPDFLKPDISAPGTNILAAWPPNILPSVFWDDHRSLKWNILSGTSMACPHVSGVVALIKSAHPNWSPAAVRSALMTTAFNRDINDDDILVEGSTQSSGPFDIGAGHMNPVAAFDPGLIYDMSTQDYVQFLCNNGYSDSHVRAMVICEPSACPSCSNLKPKSNWNINYPSITVSNLNCTTTVKRTVRYVGLTKAATYFVSIENPNGVHVDVWPRVLTFFHMNEEKTYHVILRPQKTSQGRYDFGWIIWSDGYRHQVRSPLVVQVNTKLAEKN